MKRLVLLILALAALLTVGMRTASVSAWAEANSVLPAADDAAAAELWSGLETRRELDGEGNVTFSVTLTEAQAAELDHASLEVVCHLVWYNRMSPDYQRLWREEATAENGGLRLSCRYPDRALYVVDDTSGERLAGPIDYLPNGDGGLAFYVIYSQQYGIGWKEMIKVEYRCSLDRDSGSVKINSVTSADDEAVPLVIDDAFIQDRRYISASFCINNRVPEYRDGVLLSFPEWPKDTNTLRFITIRLPCSWHLEAAECSTIPKHLISAFFQLTDRQGVTHASSLCALAPEAVRTVGVREDSAQEHALSVNALSAALYQDSELLVVEMEPSCDSNGIQGYSAGSFVINDRIQAKHLNFSTGGAQKKLLISLTREDLILTGGLNSLDFVLTAVADDYTHPAEEHVRLLFTDEEGVIWQEQAGPPHAEAGGIAWDLLRLSFPDIETLQLLYAAEETLLYEQTVDLLGFAIEDYYQRTSSPDFSLRGSMPMMQNEFIQIRCSLKDTSYQEQLFLSDPLAELGITEVHQLRLFYRVGGSSEVHSVMLELNEPVPYPYSGGQPGLYRQTVLDQSDIEVVYEQSAVFLDEEHGKNVAALGFWLRNRSENTYTAIMDSFRCNDKRAENGRREGTVECVLPANSSQYVYLQMETDIPEEQLETAQFTLFIRGLLEERIVLGLCQ